MNEVLVEKRGAALWVTINREERRNAMNDAVTFGIGDGLTAASTDPEVRAVVLTGAGDRAFCAGADLSAGSGSFQYDYSKVGVPFVSVVMLAAVCFDVAISVPPTFKSIEGAGGVSLPLS